MIKEIFCDSAVDYEFQPDGGKTPVVDAYDGCQMACPYCFQWQDQTWNENILVKTNIAEILDRELQDWESTRTLYVGSRSDPYMAMESKYHLTRRILQVINKHELPCVLSTKSSAPALLEDIGQFLAFKKRLTICIGQSNLNELQRHVNTFDLPNIIVANKLISSGLTVWIFITPVLPGITDVHAMIANLPQKTPIFLDKLRLEPGSDSERRFFKLIKDHYPELEKRYRKMISAGTDSYYQELKETYRDQTQVKFIFGEN